MATTWTWKGWTKIVLGGKKDLRRLLVEEIIVD